MSSLLNFLWSSSSSSSEASTAPNPVESSSGTPAARTPRDSFGEDSFVMVDTPSGLATPATRIEDIPVEEEIRPSTARTCRPYGAAHNPPALIPSKSSSSTPTNNNKRSFAEALKASSTTNSKQLGYAQDANMTIADQLLAKIEELERAQNASQKAVSTDASIAAALDGTGLAYSSPPFRPVVALNRQQRQLYDEKTSWTLSVDEPSSKRSKRVNSSTIDPLVTHVKRDKKHSKPARKTQKALDRNRDSKMEAMAGEQ